MNWIQLLENLGVFSVGIATMGFVAKGVFNHSLDLLNKKKVIKFSKLHDRRAEVIEELYSKLVDLEPKAEKYSITWDGKKDREAFLNATLTFVDFSQKKRIFFKGSTYKILDEIESEYMNFLSNMKTLHRKEFSEEDNKERDRSIDEVGKIIRNKIPLLKEKLEKEFRKMLGIQEQF